MSILHFIKAESGDCFLIELLDKKCILIDSGYNSTYRDELKPLLVKLASNGYRISLFVVTHIDEDHIGGAITFISENGDCNNPKIIPIDNIWFNGIISIFSVSPQLKAHLYSSLNESENLKIKKLYTELIKLLKDGEGPISFVQSEAFEILCKNNHYILNGGIEKFVREGMNIHIGTNCFVKVLSPNNGLLQKLGKWVDKKCVECIQKDYKLDKHKCIEFLEALIMIVGKENNGASGSSEIAYNLSDIDNWLGTSTNSPMNDVNRASIVLEIDIQEKKLLFMGDSESGDWIGLAQREYDFVKISHHGTNKPNASLLDNIDRIDSVLISTNGRRNHPEDELLANLLKKGVNRIYFNYNIRQKDELLALQKKYNFTLFCEKDEIQF